MTVRFIDLPPSTSNQEDAAAALDHEPKSAQLRYALSDRCTELWLG